jgi:aspartate/methionine/tyrosine aminotransferase
LGEAALRAEIVGWMGDRILGPIGPEDVALTHGGQNAISLIFDCCLRGERPVVLIEELAYPGFRYAARAARAEVVPVEIDEHGIVPQALEAACRRHGAQVLCLTTEAQNPTTGRMPVKRRQEIAEIARPMTCRCWRTTAIRSRKATSPPCARWRPNGSGWWVGVQDHLGRCASAMSSARPGWARRAG